MESSKRYVVLSLELHLFFARIMKEHSLFLEAGFTSRDTTFAKASERYKNEFETLLLETIKLSNGVIRPNVLNSGEIVTEFTACAEQQTQWLTGISINEFITKMEYQLTSDENICITAEIIKCIKQLNQTSIRLLNGLIDLKENIIHNVQTCQMFTMNYPLLLEHILREAKLYRSYVINYENGKDFDSQTMKEIEQFWNQIMMEHALFIRGLLDPSENKLIETSNEFAHDYARLLATSQEQNDKIISLNETLKFRDFKTAGVQGIQDCKIRSIILPLLADHVLREANHYIRLLNEKY